MLSWLLGYNTNELEVAAQNFKIWEEWQKTALLPSHYIDHYLYKYIPTKPGYKNMYIKYCFGCFENLIYLPENYHINKYLILLIDIYDKNKGYIRSLKGDPVGISLVRKAIKTNNMDELYLHDFKMYAYDYSTIHAHTVAYFSLSTLLLFLISNYLHYNSYQSEAFPHIDQELCKTAYFAKSFGDITYINPINKSLSIDIKQVKNTDKISNKTFNSWPSITTASVPNKCEHCERTTENHWGKFKSCLDCHLYVICNICGGEKYSIGADNMPKCILHKNDV
jgi:hypothetical protein